MENSKKRPVALYIGWLGRQNLGDEALYQVFAELSKSWCIKHPRSIIEFVRQCLKGQGRRSGPGICAASPSSGSQTKRSFSDILHQRLLPFATHSLLGDPLLLFSRGATMGILGGGTLIYGTSYLPVVQRLLSQGIPMYSFGTGVLDLTFWNTYGTPPSEEERKWDQVLLNFRKILVRGVGSQALLKRKGISSTVVGDPALAFCRRAPFSLPRTKVLGLNIGQCRNILWGNNEEEVFEIVAEAAAIIGHHGWRIRLFCVFREDWDVIIRLRDRLGQTVTNVVAEYRQPESYIQNVEQCDVFLGLKLHSVVLPFCRGVPSIMLEYRPKCRDFMKTVGAEDRCLRCDQMTSQQLVKQVFSAYEDAERIQADQIRISTELSKQLYKEFKSIASEVNGHKRT